MAVQVVTVASGFQVSSAFTLGRPDGLLAVTVPSGTATQVYVEFATMADAGPNAFARLERPDGSGAWFVVSSGPGVNVLQPATPWGRIATLAITTDVKSFALVPLLRH